MAVLGRKERERVRAALESAFINLTNVNKERKREMRGKVGQVKIGKRDRKGIHCHLVVIYSRIREKKYAMEKKDNVCK